MATWSVVSGVDKGIKLLSMGTALLCLVLLAFVLAQASILPTLSEIGRSWVYYTKNIIGLSLSSGTIENKSWQQNWTTFYWSWWIAWSPFVGMFIARISKGRTLREYILGTMFVPAIFCGTWITIFAHVAEEASKLPGSEILTMVNTNFSVAFFTF